MRSYVQIIIILSLMNKIRCAVIGVGYLGRFHAQKYKLLSHAELVAVSDINSDVVNAVSEELEVAGYTDYRELFGKVDAVSIAATTKMHYQIAKDCLEHGLHVLLEKPMTETAAEAEELIQLARAKKVKLQIGHLERFNPVWENARHLINDPLFIKAERLAPYNPRGADVNVVLNLMIHDLDIILDMVQKPVKSITAQGSSILTNDIDFASAQITFSDSSMANVTASRINFKMERRVQISQKNSYVFIDYQNKALTVYNKNTDEQFPGLRTECENKDALYEQIKSFLSCIEEDTTPVVTGEMGQYALDIANTISAMIYTNLMMHHAS